MKLFKRILVAGLSIMMLMNVLTGCGTKNDKNNSASQAPAASPTEGATNQTTPEATEAPTVAASPTTNPNAAKVKDAKAGTYTATAKGYASDVKVTVKIAKDGTIDKVDVDASGETEGIGQAAAPTIAEAIVNSQNLAVDTVSGATFTSSAIFNAVDDALQQAGVDTSNLK